MTLPLACAWVTLVALASPAAASPYRVEQVFSRLKFEKPVFLTAPQDNTHRVFVVERGGLIKVFANRDDVDEASIFLDLTAVVGKTTWEDGLLSLAFSPDFATSGVFFVFYTTDAPLRVIIARFQVAVGDPNRADRESEEVLLAIPKTRGAVADHYGGMLAFGPDGMLYVSLGDTGSEPLRHAQEPTDLWGRILRLDPRSGQRPYSIPASNPYVDGRGGMRPETWSLGFRNPWRFSFDRRTGALFVADVGQADREEINVVLPGANYGWPYFEGTRQFLSDVGVAVEGFRKPIFEYDHDVGAVIVGGYVYRGRRAPSLVGSYIYGNFGLLPRPSPVWALNYVDGVATNNRQITEWPRLSSFGEDEEGEVYLLSLDCGRIGRLVEDPVTSTTAAPCPETWETFPSAPLTSAAFPDTAVRYWRYRLHLPTDGSVALRIRGEFPRGRYMSFNVYDQWTMDSIAHLADRDLVPDLGSHNPFLPGNLRHAFPEKYEVWTTVNTAKSHANELRVPTGDESTAPLEIWYRIYAPDVETDGRGGAPLPEVSAWTAGGVSECVPRQSEDARVIQAAVNVPPRGPDGRILFYASRARALYSNADTSYLAARTSLFADQVAVVRFRAPMTLGKVGVQPALEEQTEARYWSFCLGTLATRTVDCLNDEEASYSVDRVVTVMIGDEAFRAVAVARGWNFLNSRRLSPLILIFRSLLGVPDGRGSFSRVPPWPPADSGSSMAPTAASAENFIGDYAPRGQICRLDSTALGAVDSAWCEPFDR